MSESNDDEKTVRCPSGLLVRVSKLKVKQYKLLADRKLVDTGEVFEHFLMACAADVVDPGPAYPNYTPGTVFDWKRALQGDRYTAILGIRRITHPAPFEFDVRCSKCGEEFGWQVKLRDMPVVNYPQESIKAFVAGNLMNVNVAGKAVGYRLMTGAEEERIRNHIERLKKTDKRTRAHEFDPVVDSGIARFVSVEGLKTASQIRDWYDDLDADEMLKLQHAYESTAGGIDTTLEVIHSEDPMCGGVTKVDLPFASKGFWIPRGGGLGSAATMEERRED